MNIKVAAFTVSEKSIYTIICVTTDREGVSRLVYMYFDINTDFVHKIPGLLNVNYICYLADYKCCYQLNASRSLTLRTRLLGSFL